MKRSIKCYANCHHEGCKESTFWDCDNREHYSRVEARYARNWMCTRHSHPEELLSADRPRIVHEVASERIESHLYWNRHGFCHGDGFKAFCDDFPEGTILRITAEIILPNSEGPNE